MNRTHLTNLRIRLLSRAVLLGSIACAPLAFAGADIVKCVGPDGRVTLTDTPCASDERSVLVTPAPAATPLTTETLAATEPAQASSAAAPTLARTAQMTRARLPDRAYAASTLSRLDPPGRALARDVSTLKAARQAMHLLDSAASSMRAQRLAGLR